MILVTGASGLLAGPLLKELSKKKHPVRAVSRKDYDLSDNISIKALFEGLKPEAVIHPAGFTDVDGCENDGAKAWRDNAETTRNLSRACGEKNIPFIYVSTDYVLSGEKGTPYLENDSTNPVNIYGMTKLAGEVYARAGAGRSAVVRTSWLFGPGNPKNFVNAMSRRLRTESKVGALDDQKGCATGASDLSEALVTVMEYLIKLEKNKIFHETFHFCNAGETTRFEMTRVMAKIMRRDQTEISRIDPSTLTGRVALRPRVSALSCAHYEKFFNLRIRPWQKSLEDYLRESGA